MNSNRIAGWRRSVGAAGLALVTLFVAGCGASSSGNDSPASGKVDSNGHLRIAYPVTNSLDPHLAPEPAQLTIATWPVYDRLIQISADSEYEPMLATGWEFSKDGKELTLTLREGVTFSDGTPFDAAAVKTNLDNYIAAKGTALQANVADIANVEVVDPSTVKLALERPTTTVLAGLASTLGGAMISPKALGSKDLGTKPVGTGAYVIDSYQPGQSVTYTRRTDKGGIWDEKTGKPAKVTITTMIATDARTNALRAGQIDLAVWSIDAKPFQRELDAGTLQHAVMEGALNMVGLNFNTKLKPFDEPLVRQAINHAIDREAIVEAFMPDSTPRVQPWPDGLSGFDGASEDAYAFDPDRAKELLAEAGYADGLDAGELLAAVSGRIPDAAEVIQANLADVGIKVELRNVETFALITEWPKGNASMELMFMSLPSIDPSQWVGRLFLNPMWRPGGVDTEIAQLSQGLDDPSLSNDERAEKAGAIVDYATEQALYAPMWQGAGGVVATDNVRGLDDFASVNGGVADLRNTYLVK